MVKNISALLVKKSVALSILFVFFVSIVAKSQLESTIGVGTTVNTATSYPCPLQNNFQGSRAQYLYRATELKAAGMDSCMVLNVSFNVTNLNTFNGQIDALTIKMRNTTVTALTATTWVAGATQVYAPTNYVPVLGKNTLTLTTPFGWDGTSNILVEICSGSATATSSGNVSIAQSVTAFGSSHTYVANNLGNLCAATTTTNTGTITNRPNITFGFEPKLLCDGIPIIGAASANPTNVCFGISTTLSIAGVPVASGLEYQWEDSTETSGLWSPILNPNANQKTYTTTQTVTTYYRINVKCAFTGDSVYSNVVTVTTPPLLKGAYTIDHNATTFPIGRSFINFNAAYNAMKCGIDSAVVFNVVAGTGPYVEQLIINGKIPNSSAANTITFMGNGETIKFATTTNERGVIKLKNTAFFIFDSLRVDATTSSSFGIGFHLTNNADSNIIRNCQILASQTNITAGASAGIAISAKDADAVGLGNTLCDANLLTNNTITGGYYGITLAANFGGGANIGNVVSRNSIKDFYRYGVYVKGSGSTLIDQNIISRPTRATVAAFDGVYVLDTSNTLKINGNRIFSPFKAATTNTAAFIGINFDNVFAFSANDNSATNNLIYDVVSAGDQTGINNNGGANVIVEHNTISLDNDLSTVTGKFTRGYVQSQSKAVGVTFGNNLITISRGGTGTKHCIYLAAGTTAPAYSQGNDYYMNAVQGSNSVGFFTSNRATLLDWQLAFGNTIDMQSYSVDPVYVNTVTSTPAVLLDTANFSPTNAGANDKGQFLNVLQDILKAPRSTTTPDFGAYEFVPPPCLGATVGTSEIYINGKKINSDTTVCEGTLIKLDLKITGAYGSSQTFQWEKAVSVGGNTSSVSPEILTPDYYFYTKDSSYYYRCKIKCGTDSIYSNWRLLNSVPGFIAGNYTIDNNNPVTFIRGLVGGNFNKFDTAINAMKFCGVIGTGNVTFNIVPVISGAYTEQVKIDSIKGINVNRQVVFKGNGSTLKFPATQPANNSERALIKLVRADFINFDGLVIDATTTAANGYAVQLLNNADSNSFKNCTITANSNSTSQTFAGIVVNGADNAIPTATTGSNLCDGNIFDNNTINGGYNSISFAATGTPILNNTITNNTCLNFYNSGVYLAGANTTLINHNNFSRPTRTPVGDGYGINLASVASINTTISNNRFSNFYGGQPTGTTATYGVSLNAVDANAGNENKIFNNAFYNINGLGIAYPLYNNGSDYALYYHNSIALDNPANAATGVAAGFYQTVQATGIQFANNIVYINRGGTAPKYCINLNTSSTVTGGGFTTHHNVLYFAPTVTNGHIGQYIVNYNTLAAWQNATTPNFDLSSYNYDPLYTDELNGDLKPQFYLINDKGDNTISTATDILGLPRSTSTPDIGAWEFNPPVCPTPLLAGRATVIDSTGLCLEKPIKLNLVGNSPIGQINFQWQDATSSTGPWQNLGSVIYSPAYDTITSVRNFYRCIVTCAATGASDTSTVAVENLNDLLKGGVYTIDTSGPTVLPPVPGTLAAPGTNFHSFVEAVSAMQCGILGSVIFDVQKGTFNEQVRLPYVPGTSPTSTVTFQGNNGIATDKILTYAGATSANNYVLRFDSCNYITFKNINIQNTNTTNGRVVDFVNRASYDNLVGCLISTPNATAIATTQSAVFSSPTKGTNLTIKANTITGGANGIYFAGTSSAAAGLALIGHIIDSNIISSNYGAGIFAQYTNGLTISRNKISFNAPAANNVSGIYANFCDSGFNLTNNRIDINNVNAITNGIQVLNTANNTKLALANINGNEVYANAGNTGKITGILLTSSNYVDVKNNVVAINSAAVSSLYGLRDSLNTGNINIYHNSVSITVPSPTSVAVSSFQATSGNFKLTNNIFSNTGGGKAMYFNSAGNFSSDYNMLYTTGANLINAGTGAGTNYNITTWRAASYKDKWSLVYAPAFVSNQDLHPDVNNENSWAMQGRAIQTKGDVTDINGNYRPDSLTAGVPDLGAYEFFPAVQPPALPSIPATPALSVVSPTKEQIFYFGSDTVMRVKWDSANPPATCNVSRFSGVVGQGITAQSHNDSMFFYVKVDVPGKYAKGFVKLNYIAPWLGSLPSLYTEYKIGLAKTLPNSIWNIGCNSRTDVNKKVIYDNIDAITYFDKLTGLYNPCIPDLPACSDTSNAGHEFYTFFPMHNDDIGTPSSTYVLYLAARDNPAFVTVSIPTLNYYYTYSVPANTVVVSDPITHLAQHLNSGIYNDAIHIVSDEQIVAYAHCYNGASSGATMLMPVCTWGYEYSMLSYHVQQYTDCFAYYSVIAKEDNTKIRFSSVQPTSGLPMTGDTVLNAGQWLQVFAQSSASGGAGDLTGSLVKAIPNDSGRCIPFAFFSGDMRTYNDQPCGTNGGDMAIQQNFPSTAWGKKYLTAPTSQSTAWNTYNKNLFRISLKDVNQTVYANEPNGIRRQIYPLAGSNPPAYLSGSLQISPVIGPNGIPTYVQFVTDTPCYITSNKPMMICQFFSQDCGGGNGDPDMVYLSPLEQGVRNVNFYINNKQDILSNALTLIGSAASPPTICEITIPGGSCNSIPWSGSYPHPRLPGKRVYIKQWTNYGSSTTVPLGFARQISVSSDSIFTGVTYGLGNVESYAYNAGTNIISYFPVTPPPCNEGLSATECKTYTCAGTQFKIRTRIASINPDSITCFLSKIPGIHPNQDVVFRKPYVPAPDTSFRDNGDTIFTFTLPGLYTIDNAGNYLLQYKMFSQEIEGCDKSISWDQDLRVLHSPKVDFAYLPNPICPNTNVNFTAGTVDSTTFITVRDWTWKSSPYGISADSLKVNTYSHLYVNSGSDTVNLRVRTDDYCVGDTSHILTINPNPVVAVVQDSTNICQGATGTISIQSPLAGASYSFYTDSTAGTKIKFGDGLTPFTFPSIVSDTSFYVECISSSGCVSVSRKLVKFTVTPIPSVTATPLNDTICIGTTATFNVVNPNPSAVYSWYDVATGGTPTLGTSYTVNSVVNNATYYVEVSINSCVSTVRFPVNLVAAAPPSIAVVTNTLSVCTGNSATFNIQNPDATVTYNWYTTATGGTATNDTSYTINPAITNASYFVSATSKFGCTTSPRLQVDLTVIAKPVVTVVTDSFTICSGNNVSYTISAPIAGATYYVYSTATGGTGTSVGDGTTPIVFNNITSNTSYFIECVLSSGCKSDRKEVKVVVVAIPVATATPAAITACIGTDTAFRATNIISGATYTWYDAVTAGNIVVTDSELKFTPVTANGTYYLEVAVGTCVSTSRFPVILNAATAPTVAVVSNAITACNGNAATFNIQSPDATVIYNWYATATGGTPTSGTSYTISPAVANASYYVSGTSVNGCVSIPRLKVDLTVTQRPVVTITAPDSLSVCKGTSARFTVLNPDINAVYNWYSDAAGTSIVVANNATFTTPLVNGYTTYYVDGTLNGCASVSKATVKVDTLVVLGKPIVTGTNQYPDYITFSWQPIANAITYKISVNDSAYETPNGVFTSPPSHTLLPYTKDTAHAYVIAVGANACQNDTSFIAYGKTVKQTTYYPNVFSPGSGNANDKITICGTGIKQIQYAVFNQWGQKIWETTTSNQDARGCFVLWDGTHNGTLQPAGVYMYASKTLFVDGRVENKTGSINLVR